MNDQINDHIIRFLARKESPEDVQKLKEWLASDPDHREDLKQWLSAWDAAGTVSIEGKLNLDEAYRRFMFRLNRETLPKTAPKLSRTDVVFSTIRRIAAIFVIAFSLGMLCQDFLSGKRPEQIAFIENIVPLGSKSEIKLPDGSSVYLNAGSTLRYPTVYGKTTRDVYLEGEGYFKVSRQAGKPFTVHTALSNIRALGTEFNVKAYPDEDVVETTLIKGEVAVEKGETGGAIDQAVLLKPGQKLSVTAHAETLATETKALPHDAQSNGATSVPDEQPIQPAPVVRQLTPSVAAAEVSWKERNWRIESEPLQDLIVKLDRRYDVRIEVDELLKSYRFTGTIKDESLEQVLYAMQLTAPIRFKVEGKTVYIHTDPKRMK